MQFAAKAIVTALLLLIVFLTVSITKSFHLVFKVLLEVTLFGVIAAIWLPLSRRNKPK